MVEKIVKIALVWWTNSLFLGQIFCSLDNFFVLWTIFLFFRQFFCSFGQSFCSLDNFFVLEQKNCPYKTTTKNKDFCPFDQEALNTWRGRLQHFLQLLYNQKIQKVILIWFVHLLKSNKFPEFHRCGSKNVPATPIFILNFPRAWQSF